MEWICKKYDGIPLFFVIIVWGGGGFVLKASFADTKLLYISFMVLLIHGYNIVICPTALIVN